MSKADPNTGTNESNGTTNPKNLSGEGGAPHFEPSGDETWPLHVSDPPLHKAAYTGDFLLLASLISNCDDVDALSFYECTPLHLAIRGNHATAVSLLLSAGSDPSIEDTMDVALFPSHNAVDLAAYTGASHAMAALIDAGLSVPASTFERCASLNHVDCMGAIYDKLSGTDFSDCTSVVSMRRALELAARCWHLEAVEFLLTRLTRLSDLSTLDHQTTLGQALAATSDFEYICIDECRWWTVTDINPARFNIIREKLIAAGADMNIERNEAFWRAILIGDPDAIRKLLKNGLRHDSQTNEGQTPLFGLVEAENDDEISIVDVEAFIAEGADVNHKDRALRTPMHYTANQATAEMLCRHGADLFAKDKRGMTPLHTACRKGYLNVIQFLLAKGAAVDDATITGRTPLLCIPFEEEDECEGPSFSPGSFDVVSRTEVAKVLLDHGANIHAATNGGYTVLHGAAWSGDTKFIRFLVEHGANVRAIAANGETPLHYAARAGGSKAVRYLIEQGADVHACTTDGETVIHAACATPGNIISPSNAKILETLLDSGVNANARNAKGSTALHLSYDMCYSHHRSNTEAINLLLRRGADRSIANNKGEDLLKLVQQDTKWDWDAEGLLEVIQEPIN
jgi:ankyrin repeat protein